MPRGDKSSYSNKQKRQAEHIEEGYEDRGVSRREAERRAWATVNKETGGGKKRGSGRGHKTSRSRSPEGGGGGRGGPSIALEILPTDLGREGGFPSSAAERWRQQPLAQHLGSGLTQHQPF